MEPRIEFDACIISLKYVVAITYFYIIKQSRFFILLLRTLTSCSTSVPKSSVTLDLPQPMMVHNWFVGKGCFGAGRHAIPLEGDGVKVSGKRSRATSLSTVSASYSGWMVTESTYTVTELISGGMILST